MKIAVTGGSGMVGRNLRDVVQDNLNISNNDISTKNNHEYVFLTRSDFDCENRDAVMEHFKKTKYDAIVHLAACVGGLFMHINNNQVVYEKNKRINDNIIDACVASGIKRGIFCSSSCVFTPDPPYFPMDESMHLIGETHPTNRGYANAKREMYQRCKKLNEEDGYKYMCLIPVNMYGKYDNFDIQNGHFVPALMHRFEMTKRAVRNASAFNSYSDIPTKSPYEEKYVAYGDGSPLRQLLYARDFAQIIYQLLLENNHVKWIYDSVIVCNDEEYTIKEVVEKIAHTMDLDKDKIVWDTTKANGCLRKTVSNARLKILGITPDGTHITTSHTHIKKNSYISLSESLRETYMWFIKHYNTP